MNNGLNKFKARNNAQVYKARDLSRAYAEFYAVKSFQKRLTMPDVTDQLRPILNLIGLVYGFWSLEKHLPTFYQGCFASGDAFADTIRSELLNFCAKMKDSSVAIVDALAPPDFVLNSVIGKSDGLVSIEIWKKIQQILEIVDIISANFFFQLYQNLQNEFLTNPGAMERASWWKDVRLPIAKSKL